MKLVVISLDFVITQENIEYHGLLEMIPCNINAAGHDKRLSVTLLSESRDVCLNQ